MLKKKQQGAAWSEEVARLGLECVIAHKLTIHGGFYLSFVSVFTGCDTDIIKNHLDTLVKKGIATRELRGNDWHYHTK